MCRDIQHGGQRCAAETRKGVTAAMEAVQAAEEDLRLLERGTGGPDSDRRDAHVRVAEAYADLRAAHIEHASTPSGQKEFADEQVKAYMEKDSAAFSHRYWDEVLDRGADLAQRNKDIGAAMQDAIAAREQAKIAARERVTAQAAQDKARDEALRKAQETNPDAAYIEDIDEGEYFHHDGEVYRFSEITERDEDNQQLEIDTDQGVVYLPMNTIVDRCDDDTTGAHEPTAADVEAWVRDDEAQVAGDPAPTGRARLISRTPAAPHLSEDEFEAQYGPIHQTDLDPDANTYWDEPPTEQYPAERIWTVVENGENDNQYLLPGVHHVNRIGYIASEKPWTDPNIEVLYFDYAANMHPDALRSN